MQKSTRMTLLAAVAVACGACGYTLAQTSEGPAVGTSAGTPARTVSAGASARPDGHAATGAASRPASRPVPPPIPKEQTFVAPPTDATEPEFQPEFAESQVRPAGEAERAQAGQYALPPGAYGLSPYASAAYGAYPYRPGYAYSGSLGGYGGYGGYGVYGPSVGPYGGSQPIDRYYVHRPLGAYTYRYGQGSRYGYGFSYRYGGYLNATPRAYDYGRGERYR